MNEIEPPSYGTTDRALGCLVALLFAVVVACLGSGCSPAVKLRRLPPPLTGDLACSDPLAQCLTREGACWERRRGECR
jgi:hypothetical protein